MMEGVSSQSMVKMLFDCEMPILGLFNILCWLIEQNFQDPQVVTGSHDTSIKLWDLAAGL